MGDVCVRCISCNAPLGEQPAGPSQVVRRRASPRARAACHLAGVQGAEEGRAIGCCCGVGGVGGLGGRGVGGGGAGARQAGDGGRQVGQRRGIRARGRRHYRLSD
jgi:hypothetical protein